MPIHTPNQQQSLPLSDLSVIVQLNNNPPSEKHSHHLTLLLNTIPPFDAADLFCKLIQNIWSKIGRKCFVRAGKKWLCFACRYNLCRFISINIHGSPSHWQPSFLLLSNICIHVSNLDVDAGDILDKLQKKGRFFQVHIYMTVPAKIHTFSMYKLDNMRWLRLNEFKVGNKESPRKYILSTFDSNWTKIELVPP